MLDSTTIELHLIDNGLRKTYNPVGIFTIETIKSLPKSELTKHIAIQDDIFFSVYKWYFFDSKIYVLELPKKYIRQNQRNDAEICGYRTHYFHDKPSSNQPNIFPWNNIFVHAGIVANLSVFAIKTSLKRCFKNTNGAQGGECVKTIWVNPKGESPLKKQKNSTFQYYFMITNGAQERGGVSKSNTESTRVQRGWESSIFSYVNGAQERTRTSTPCGATTSR